MGSTQLHAQSFSMKSSSVLFCLFLLYNSFAKGQSELPCEKDSILEYSCYNGWNLGRRFDLHWSVIESESLDVAIRISANEKNSWFSVGQVSSSAKNISIILLVRHLNGNNPIWAIYEKSDQSVSTWQLALKERANTIYPSSVEIQNGMTDIRLRIELESTQLLQFSWTHGICNDIATELSTAEWHSATLAHPQTAEHTVSLPHVNAIASNRKLLSYAVHSADFDAIQEPQPASKAKPFFNPHAYLTSKEKAEKVFKLVNDNNRYVIDLSSSIAAAPAVIQLRPNWWQTILLGVMMVFIFMIGCVVGAYLVMASSYNIKADDVADLEARKEEAPAKRSLATNFKILFLSLLGVKQNEPIQEVRQEEIERNESISSVALGDEIIDQNKYILGTALTDKRVHESIVGGLLSNIIGIAVRQRLSGVEKLKVVIQGDSWTLLTGRSKGFYAYLRKLNFHGAITTEGEAFTDPLIPEIQFDLGSKQRGGKLLKEKVPIVMTLRENEYDATRSIKTSRMLHKVLETGWIHVRSISLMSTDLKGLSFPEEFPEFKVQFRRGCILLTEVIRGEYASRTAIKWALECSIKDVEGENVLHISEATSEDESFINCRMGTLDRKKYTMWTSQVDMPEKVNWLKCDPQHGWLEYSYAIFLDC